MIKPFGKDEAFARKMIETYKKARTGKLPAEPDDLLDAVMTDLRFRVPAIGWAAAQSRHQKNIFSYLFTYKSSAMGGILGACHASEIPFVFDELKEKPRGINSPRTPETDKLTGEMMDAWAAFAHNGNPSHDAIDPWTPYNTEKRYTMLLGN